MTPRDILLALLDAPARLAVGLTLYGEARGEIRAGQIAVAWTIRNRSHNRKQTPQMVCLAPWQYSCWPSGTTPTLDANQYVVLEHAERLLKGEPLLDHPLLLGCLDVADVVLGDLAPDPTSGSDHYMTIARFHQVLRDPDHDPAKWCLAMTRTVTVGRHIFFRSAEAHV